MSSSTSDNLRLKQPCATIIERLDMEKVTFGVLNSCGRITDACFENAYICRKNILADSANFGRTYLDLLSTDKQTGNGLALSLSPLSNSLICS